MTNKKLTKFNSLDMIPDGYIYISHLDEDLKFWRLPSLPDSISDTMSSTFTPTTALGRSAPVYTFSNAGPRQVGFSLKVHRDMMDDANIGVSNSQLAMGEDYIENLIKALQAIAVPKYNLNNKAVEPPLVALRIANQIFIKGIVSSTIQVTYNKPILYDNKYAEVQVEFTITEVDPYDAATVYKNGSFRGVVKTLKNSGMGFAADE